MTAINYYARKEYTYSGGGATFSIPFSYINKDYINVYVNGTRTTGWTWLNSSQIQVNSPVLTNGDKVLIVRETPISSKLVTFTDTSILDEDVQNLAQDQNFDAVQEIYDFATFADDSIKTNLSISEDYKNQAATSAYNASVKAAETYATYQEAMSVIASTTNASVASITNTKTSAINEVNNTKVNGINSVNAAKTSAINEINTKLNTAKNYAEKAIGWNITYEPSTTEPSSTEDMLVFIDRTPSEITSATNYVTDARDSAISSINAAKTSATAAIESTKATAISSVNSAKTSALSAIGESNTQGARKNAIDAINSAKNTALSDIGQNNSTGARGNAISAINTALAQSTSAISSSVTAATTAALNSITTATTNGTSSINIETTQGVSSINSAKTSALTEINATISAAETSIEASRAICEEMAQRATLGWNIEFQDDSLIFTSVESEG